eukprot:gene10727-12692_t
MALNATQGWVVGDEDTLLWTEDKGESWSLQHSGVPPPCESCLRYIWRGVSFEGALWQTQDSMVEYSTTLHTVQSVGDSRVFVAGTGDTILFSGDGGQTWQPQTSRTAGMDFRAMHFLTPSLGWVVGEPRSGAASSTRIVRTSNGGGLWEVIEVTPALALYSVFFMNELIGYAAGEDGAVLFTGDGGLAWIHLESATTVTLYGILLDSGTGYGFAVGTDGVVIESVDFGRTWALMPVYTLDKAETLRSIDLWTHDVEGIDCSTGDPMVMPAIGNAVCLAHSV